MPGSEIHSVSACLWGNLSFTPECVIISTSWRRMLFLANSNVLFSERIFFLEFALHMLAPMCVETKVYMEGDGLLELHTLVDRNGDDRATSACHQPTSGMFVTCGRRKCWCSNDVTDTSAKTLGSSLLITCFLIRSNDTHYCITTQRGYAHTHTPLKLIRLVCRLNFWGKPYLNWSN